MENFKLEELMKLNEEEKIKKFIGIFQHYNHFDQHHGLRLQLDEKGQIHYFLTIEEKHLSSPGICHGGVLSGMMDSTLGLTALLSAVKDNKLCSTVEFKINYLAPAHLGDVLQGIGKIEFQGTGLIVTTGDIIRVEGQKLIAKGLGTFNLYPMAKKAKLYGQNGQKSSDHQGHQSSP